MTEEVLHLELRLLILRYSRRRVIEGLAALGAQSVEDIERELRTIAERKDRKQRKPKQIAEAVSDACLSRPEIAELIRLLAARFDARTFLPQLRDVERFLERAGITRAKLKSRPDSAGRVIRALAGLPKEELQRLAAPPTSTGQSDFALLAREIMGGPRDRGQEE